MWFAEGIPWSALHGPDHTAVVWRAIKSLTGPPSRLLCLCPHPEMNRQTLDTGCQLGYSDTWSFSWQEPLNALYFPLCL